MRAIIDLGTNTFHLLIAEINKGEIIEFFQKQIPVKIGLGGINEGKITEEAYLRGINALAEFYSIIQSYAISNVLATGTSAIRNAKNGEQFLAEVKSRFGFEVQQISGNREAELIYVGVKKSFQFPKEPLVVMDIGGGSVELIIGIQDTILWKQSFEVGAARLLDIFRPNDPITPAQINAIEEYLLKTFKPFSDALIETRIKYGKCNTLVGSAGSFETLLDVLQVDLKYKHEAVSKFAKAVKMSDASVFYAFILTSTREEREKMQGLLPFRIGMIVVATLLMRHLSNNYGFSEIIVSHYALKEGLLLGS